MRILKERMEYIITDIKRIMKEKKITAYRLSKDLKINEKTLSNWLNLKSLAGYQAIESFYDDFLKRYKK